MTVSRTEPPPTVDGARDGLIEVANAIQLARKTVSQGDFVDLAGLERRVDEVCAAIRQLEPSAARTVEPQLLGIVDDLDRLQGELAAQRDRVRSELGNLAEHGRAASAYGRPPR